MNLSQGEFNYSQNMSMSIRRADLVLSEPILVSAAASPASDSNALALASNLLSEFTSIRYLLPLECPHGRTSY
jgi:hypothetical protein